MTKQFGCLICSQWHWHDLSFEWHWHVHWHRCLFWRDELRILWKRLAFIGNAVCFNCFSELFCEKCTLHFTNVKEDLKNAKKWLRKTVLFWSGLASQEISVQQKNCEDELFFSWSAQTAFSFVDSLIQLPCNL